MAWTDGDLKLFAAGLAIGGKWNRGQGGLPPVRSSVSPGTYWQPFAFTLFCPADGAVIFYSLDGSTPVTRYAGEALPVQSTTEVLAFAVRGPDLSAVSVFRYVFDNPFEPEDTVLYRPISLAEGDVDVCVSSLCLEAEDCAPQKIPALLERPELELEGSEQ